MPNTGPGDEEIERALRELSEEISGKARKAAQTMDKREAKEAAKREKRLRRARRRRRLVPRLTAWAIALAVVAVAGLVVWQRFGTGSSVGALNDTNPVRNGAVPTDPTSAVAPSPPSGLTGPPADPFAGTPADHWAVGAAGIVVPTAGPHGQFTAAQVAGAYQMTRKMLIAGYLDWPTLRGGAPTAFADLLTSQQRSQFVDGLDKIGKNKQGFPLSTRQWVMSFAPGTISFVTTVVKVHGSMSAGIVAQPGGSGRALRVHIHYRFVYVVEPPGHPDDWMRIVAQEDGSVDFAQWTDPGGPLEPWATQIGPAPAGAQCGMTDGYVHPAYPNGVRSSAQASGSPIDPYSSAVPPTSNTYVCWNSKGT